MLNLVNSSPLHRENDIIWAMSRIQQTYFGIRRVDSKSYVLRKILAGLNPGVRSPVQTNDGRTLNVLLHRDSKSLEIDSHQQPLSNEECVALNSGSIEFDDPKLSSVFAFLDQHLRPAANSLEEAFTRLLHDVIKDARAKDKAGATEREVSDSKTLARGFINHYSGTAEGHTLLTVFAGTHSNGKGIRLFIQKNGNEEQYINSLSDEATEAICAEDFPNLQWSQVCDTEALKPVAELFRAATVDPPGRRARITDDGFPLVGTYDFW